MAGWAPAVTVPQLRDAFGPSTQPQAAGPGEPPPDTSGKKIACGVLAIVLGSLGIHKFVLGYTKAGLIMLLVSVLTCGIGAAVMGVIGLVEGILYLTKSDGEFYDTYVGGRKEWF
jgi:TM2 domain-containing membrane protein YozV